MSMIPCPECKKRISEFADSCPKCGVTLTEESVEKQKKIQSRNETTGLCLGIGMLCLMIGGCVFVNNVRNRRPTSTAPRTMLGYRSRSPDKHLDDAVKYLLNDGRKAVRSGQWTKTEFEEYTGVKY